MKRILVFVNFTEASLRAVHQAIVFANSNGAELNICHISPKAGDGDAEAKLQEYAAIAADKGIQATVLHETGEFFASAPKVTAKTAPDLVVIGTIGAEGFDIKHFGSAIYKLVRMLPAASLVVHSNEHGVSAGFQHVMLPLGHHRHFPSLIAPLTEVMAPDSQVTLLAVLKEGSEPDAMLVENAARVKEELDRLGVKWAYKELRTARNISGQASVILAEMASSGMDLIAIPADVAPQNQLFGKMDKEALLNNGQGFSAWCVNTDLF